MHWTDRIGRRVRLRDLHILLAVAQWGSMAKAAEHLAISHPVISKTISDLERALGVRLLDRSSQGVEPTVYGREVLNCSVAVFDELRQGVKRIEFLTDPTAGELRIGSSDPLMAGFVPAVIDRLTRANSRIVVHTIQGTVADLHRALRERKIDLVIARQRHSPSDQELAEELLFYEPLFVVTGMQNPWARRPKISLADLIDEPWIMLPAESVAGPLIVDAFRECGLPMPRTAVVSDSIPLRNSLLATGRFLTVFARSTLHFTAKHLSLKVLPVKFPIESRPIVIVTLKNRTMVPVAQLFIEHARAVAKSMNNVP